MKIIFDLKDALSFNDDTVKAVSGLFLKTIILFVFST